MSQEYLIPFFMLGVVVFLPILGAVGAHILKIPVSSYGQAVIQITLVLLAMMVADLPLNNPWYIVLVQLAHWLPIYMAHARSAQFTNFDKCWSYFAFPVIFIIVGPILLVLYSRVSIG